MFNGKIPFKATLNQKPKKLKNMGCKIYYWGNAKTEKAALTTLVSNKLYSRPNNIKGDKECHFTIHGKDKIAMKIY